MSESEPAADQTRKALNHCPSCSREMESGYVYTPSTNFRSVRWSTELALDMMELKGETLVPMNMFGSIKIAGFRCSDCRVLVLTY